MATLSIDSDNVVELRNLKNYLTGEAITTAVVTVTIVEKITGVAVSGVSWPLSLPHIANGIYQGVVKNDAVLNKSLSYIGTLVADNGVDQHREWCIQYTAACS